MTGKVQAHVQESFEDEDSGTESDVDVISSSHLRKIAQSASGPNLGKSKSHEDVDGNIGSASTEDGLQPPIEDLYQRVEELHHAATSRDILIFLNSLRVDNSKTGISLSWNRALKVMKAHGIITSDYKPYSQLRSGEKLEVTAKLNGLQDDVIISDLKNAILEGFVDSRYPKRRKLQKWSNPGIDENGEAGSLIDGENVDGTIASRFAQMVNSVNDGNIQALPAKHHRAKETELLLEQIKSVKVERLQKAINDTVTWNLLTQDVRDGVLAEYAKLLMK